MSYTPNPPLTDELMHYGMPRRSGRYPWGSGEEPYQHSRDFLGRVEEMRKANFTYTDENGKKWTGDNAIAKLPIDKLQKDLSNLLPFSGLNPNVLLSPKHKIFFIN